MLIIMQLIVMLLSIIIMNKKFNNFDNKTKNSIIILFILTAITSNLLLKLIPMPYDEVKIIATGEKHESSGGRGIKLESILIDKEYFDIVISSGLWNKSGDSYVWYPESNSNMDVNLTREIIVKVPLGSDRQIILQNGNNRGIVNIEFNSMVNHIDLYKDGDATHKSINIPPTPGYLIFLLYLLKLTLWFLIIFLFYKFYHYTTNYKFIKILTGKCKFVFTGKNILIIVCLISNLIFSNYICNIIFYDNIDIVTIKALDKKNVLSQNSKITLQNMTVSGKNLQLKEPIEGLWENLNGKFIWNKTSDIENITNIIKLEIPKGYNRTINFHNEQSSGIVEVIINDNIKIIDLYKDSINGIISIPIESNSKMEIHLFKILKLITQILISFIQLIIIMKIKKYLLAREILEFDKKTLIIICTHFIISFSTDKIFFNSLAISEKTEIYLIIKLLFLISLCAFWGFIFHIPRLLKNDENKLFIKISLMYFFLLLIHVILSWPGTPYWDTYGILNPLKELNLNYWQHYLTSIYYGILLMFIPLVGGLSITQSFIYSLVVGYITKEFFKLFRYSKKSLIIILVWFLPPVIYYSTYMLRLNAIGFFEPLFMILSIKLIYNHSNIRANKLSKIFYILLASIMFNWRSEAFYYGILVPIFIIIWNYDFIDKKINFKCFFKECLLFFCLVIIIIVPQNVGIGKSEAYQLTGVRESLHYLYNNVDNIINDPLNDVISEHLDIDILFNTENSDKAFGNSPSIYITENNNEVNNIIKNTTIKLILKYPFEFIKGRVFWFSKALFDANSIEPVPANATHLNINENFNYTDNLIDVVIPNNRFNYISFLRGKLHFSNIIKHTWSLLIPIVTICLYFIYFLINIKTKWREFLVILIPCFRITAVFLASPNVRFMYYFPAYLVGWLLFVLAICQLLENIEPQQLQLEARGVDSIIKDEDLLDENETDIKDEDEIESETGEDIER